MTKNISYQIIEKKPLKLWELDYLKNYLRITHDYDDALIMSLLEAAIEMAENYTGLSLHQKVIRIHIKQLISSSINLKYLPILDVLGASEIINNQGDKQEIKSKDLELDREGGLLKISKSFWSKEVEIVYIAGHQLPNASLSSFQEAYKIEVQQVPFPVQTGILLLLEMFYERGQEENVSHYEALKHLMPYRKLKI